MPNTTWTITRGTQVLVATEAGHTAYVSRNREDGVWLLDVFETGTDRIVALRTYPTRTEAKDAFEAFATRVDLHSSDA